MLRRQFHLIALLRSSGFLSLETLADRAGVCVRTIRRDLSGLEEAHMPIMDHVGEDGVRRFKLQRGAPCPVCGRDTIRGAELRRELSAMSATEAKSATCLP